MRKLVVIGSLLLDGVYQARPAIPGKDIGVPAAATSSDR
jgi:hypothetical protein